MPFATIGDLKIYYENRGSGSRLLYIGGTGGDLRQPPNVFDQPLAKVFNILAYDQRGMGQSSAPDRPYTMADYAEDAAALAAALGWQDYAVLGYSFGGMVAQELAIRYPQRVTRLLLCCTSSGGAGGASYPLHQLQDLPIPERAAKLVELGDTRRDSAWQAEHRSMFNSLVQFTSYMIAEREKEPLARQGARRQLAARQAHDTWDRLPQLKMPVLICGGHFDGISPPENLHALARQIPQAELTFFDGGHLFHLQDANAFEEMIRFLSQQS